MGSSWATAEAANQATAAIPADVMLRPFMITSDRCSNGEGDGMVIEMDLVDVDGRVKRVLAALRPKGIKMDYTIMRESADERETRPSPMRE